MTSTRPSFRAAVLLLWNIDPLSCLSSSTQLCEHRGDPHCGNAIVIASRAGDRGDPHCGNAIVIARREAPIQPSGYRPDTRRDHSPRVDCFAPLAMTGPAGTPMGSRAAECLALPASRHRPHRDARCAGAIHTAGTPSSSRGAKRRGDPDGLCRSAGTDGPSPRPVFQPRFVCYEGRRRA